MSRYLKILRERPQFRRLWASNIVSNLGDWLSYIAVSVLVVRENGSPLALAVLFILHSLPYGLLAPVAGPVADRFDRRTLMMVAHLGRAALTLGMTACAATGALWMLQALLLLRVLLAGLFFPAERAALPRLVEPDEVEDANALDSLTWSTLFAVGVALGGFLVSWVGPTLALMVDTGTFLVAAWLVRGLPPIRPIGQREAGGLFAALKFTAARPELIGPVFAKVPLQTASGGAWVVLNLAAFSIGSPWDAAVTLGILQALRGAGTGIGPAVGFALERRAGRRFGGWADFVGLSLVVAFCLTPVLTGVLWPLAVATLLWGVASGWNWVWSTSALQRMAPDQWMGRLSALDMLCMTLGQTLGALAGGLVADHTGRYTDAGWAAMAAAALLFGCVWGWSRRARAAR